MILKILLDTAGFRTMYTVQYVYYNIKGILLIDHNSVPLAFPYIHMELRIGNRPCRYSIQYNHFNPD